ncbi:MAG: hypothetical protein KDA77_00295 [Planctomycetaceae bacterium]|nr:hypothetical protein [Planctomycetaceae bacterium]
MLIARMMLNAQSSGVPGWQIDAVLIDTDFGDPRPLIISLNGSYYEIKWSEVSWYIPLDELKSTLPEIPAPCSPGDQPRIDDGVLFWKSADPRF